MSEYFNDNLGGAFGSGTSYDGPNGNSMYDNSAGMNQIKENMPYDHVFNEPSMNNGGYGSEFDRAVMDERGFDNLRDDRYDGPRRDDRYDSSRDDRYDGPRRDDRYDSPRDDRYDGPRRDDRYDSPRDDRYDGPRRDDRYDSSRDDRYDDSRRDDRRYDGPRDNRYDNHPKDNKASSAKTELGGLKKKLADNKIIVAFAALLVVLIILICCVSKAINSSSNGTITIYYVGFNDPYIQYQLSEEKWTKSPGVKMSDSDMEGYSHEFSVELGASKYMMACFNDSNGNTDNNNGKYYKFTSGTYCFNDGTITQMGEEVSVPGGDLKIDSFTVSPSDGIFAGDEVTIEAKASGGAPKYSYAFGYFKANGEEVELAPYGYESSVTWVPEESGTFDLYVKVKDSDTSLKQKEITGFVVAGLSISGIQTSEQSPVTKNTTVKLTATIENTIGSDDIECQYLINDGSNTQTIKASSSGEADWTPYEEGNYTITCEVDDGEGHTASYEIDFEVTADNNDHNNNNNSDSVTIYYKGFDNAHIHYELGGVWTNNPGIAMQRTSEMPGYDYKATIHLNGHSHTMVCFNDGGNNWDSNNGGNYYFQAGTYTYKDGNINQVGSSGNNNDNNNNSNTITIYYGGDISDPYIHYQIGNGEWINQDSDIKMEKASGLRLSYKYVVTIDLGGYNSLTACFRDGNYNWDNNGGNNYYFEGPGEYYVKNGEIKTSNWPF